MTEKDIDSRKDEIQKPQQAKGKEELNKQDGGLYMPLKEDSIKSSEPVLQVDEDISEDVPMAEFIYILQGIEDKLRKTRNLKSNAIKNKYITRIRQYIADFKGYEIKTGLQKSYLDLQESARQLSLSFRLQEDEKKFMRRIDRHLNYFETAKAEFAGGGKWVKTVKIGIFIFMACVMVLLPPLLNMSLGQVNFILYVLTFVICAAVIIVLGSFVIKQFERRKKIAWILIVCITPLVFLVSGFWIVYGVNILLGFDEYLQSLSQSAAGMDLAAVPGYAKFVIGTLPVIGIILIVDMCMLLWVCFKNRKLLTA